MANTDRYDQAIGDELDKIDKDMESARYPHERNDEYGLRLIAEIEDDIDRLEGLIVDLDKLRANIIAPL